MAGGHSSGTIDLTEIEYSEWKPEGSPVVIHMHLDAVDGIIRDINEEVESFESGGLLLGRVRTGDQPSVWIDRYERILCGHKSGPRFILDGADKAALEKAAADVLAAGELAVVGLYRSHLRDGFDLADADFELIRNYFSDASDLVLLIKPQSPRDLSARFYVHDVAAGARAAGEPFPFRGRVLNPPDPEPIARERPRRLVPDFLPAIEESDPTENTAKSVPLPMLFAPREPVFDEDERTLGQRLRKWLPFVAALLLAGGGVWWASQSSRPASAPASHPVVAPGEIARPLGLAVEPMGPAWQVSWNPNATALHDARSVQLFVRGGDDQNRIDLSPRDLAAGIYKYEATGNDFTFRLEVVEGSGRVSAESFRFVRSQAPVKTAALTPAAPVVTNHRRTGPKVTHRAPPVIAAGVRPRITSPIPIDVRVEIDDRGRVTSAAPVTKPHKGIEAYLAGTAVKAARLWRFEPARENGKPVNGSETLHFVFQK
jgi:Gram-negative bacterial TonB protein C-terminal